MESKFWKITANSDGAIPLDEIPVIEYTDFLNEMDSLLKKERYRTAHYFGVATGRDMVFYCLVLDDERSKVLVTSHLYEYYGEKPMQSLAARHPSFHVFEREIKEIHGINFNDSPWDKPLRYPWNRFGKPSDGPRSYPFYNMDGPSLHEVNVGPVHAGIIEPGAFRFICNGEKVLHLEIALGYQHRGVETLITGTSNKLKQCVLADSIAGDSAVAHATGYARVIEKLSVDYIWSRRLERERAVAGEVERIAMHIADTGALCSDIGYQLGQVACEALRTVVINTTLKWCGSRFAKGLIRPHGTNYPLTPAFAEEFIQNLKEVQRRYDMVISDLKSNPAVLSRFEDCGMVPGEIMKSIGGVGMAARACGLPRDIRKTHPYGIWGRDLSHGVITESAGDVMARLLIRAAEIKQSVKYIYQLLSISNTMGNPPVPEYGIGLQKNSLSYSLSEGWRGEVCHVGITGPKGTLENYKIKDPSLHNWLALALAVKGEGISDFPVCNKSFNLSYCGHDL